MFAFSTQLKYTSIADGRAGALSLWRATGMGLHLSFLFLFFFSF
jgi:hypothetical protein